MAPDDDLMVAEGRPVGPHLGQGRAGARVFETVVDPVVVDVPRLHLVGVVEVEQVDALVAHVTQLERRVAHDLVLEAEVPLPVGGDDRAQVAPMTGRSRPGRETAVAGLSGRVELPDATLGLRKRRVGGVGQSSAEPLAQEELTYTGANGGLAVSRDVPCDAEARREELVVLVLERAVRSGGATLETRLLAPVGPRRLNEPVAGIAAESRVEERGHEARDLVVVGIVVEKLRVPDAVIDRHPRMDLPGVGDVKLEILPALRNLT